MRASRARREYFIVAASFAAYLALICWAGWPRLTHAQLWAEDGKLFLADALGLGGESLLRPYDGYLHTMPRLFAWAYVCLFGIRRYATAVALVCYATLAAVCALFVHNTFRWLVPSRFERAVVAALVLFSPGLSEVLGNLANLHYVLLVALTLFGLRDPRHSTSPWQLGLVFLGAMTEGACWLLLLPMGLRLLVRRRLGCSSRSDAYAMAAVALAGALHVLAYVKGLHTGATSRADLPWIETMRAMASLLSERLVVMPWTLGEGVAKLREFGASTEVLVGIVPICALCYALVRRLGALRAAWALSLPLVFVALLLLTFVVRPGTLGIIVGHPIGYRARYAFASHLPATIAWAAALPALGPRLARPAFALLVGLQVALGARELPFRPYAPGAASWRAALEASPDALRASGQEARCIPIAPEHWEVCLPNR